MTTKPRLGAKVRSLRRRAGLSQARLAERLEISASYLNLIEHNHRPLSAALLIKLAQAFQLDIQAFAADDDSKVVSELLEVFSDDLFVGHELTGGDVRELAQASPAAARAVLKLYEAYRTVRESAGSLAARLSDGSELAAVDRAAVPSEEVSAFIQRHANHFADLEQGAAQLWRDAELSVEDLFRRLAKFAHGAFGVEVEIRRVGQMRGAVRHFDPVRKRLLLSEVLRRGSRNFQLAHQIGLLTQASALERLAAGQTLTTDESRALCRVALANYFAGAVVMPYETFLEAAQKERYDIELLGHRFRTSYEQVCHRLTTLRRANAEGIAFHMVRVDIAGNISKHFSATGMRFARFSGACPRWNVHAAFLTPGRIRVQLSRMPDGTAYFDVARTVRQDAGGYRAAQAVHAISLGCAVQDARRLIYADGIDLENLDAAQPVGVTCRLCERTDCEQRAMPGLLHPMHINENTRGVSFYAPVLGR